MWLKKTHTDLEDIFTLTLKNLNYHIFILLCTFSQNVSKTHFHDISNKINSEC